MALTVASIETAIESIIATGQAMGSDGMTLTRASLPSLWDARKQLKAEESRATRPTIRAVNFGGMGYSTDGQSDVTPVATDPIP